jgi:hypothetical protein
MPLSSFSNRLFQGPDPCKELWKLSLSQKSYFSSMRRDVIRCKIHYESLRSNLSRKQDSFDDMNEKLIK